MPNPISDFELAGLVAKTPLQIIQFFRRKGYDITWSWRDMWQDAHARSFTVAKAMRKDILDVLRAGVDQAIAEGWSQQRFVREMTNALKAKGWWGRQIVTNPQGIDELVQLGSPWRLKTIYRTNQTVAFSRGRYQVMKDNAERRPFWMYDAVNDSVTRDSHRAMDNKIYRADNPIWQRIHPPNGWNCFLPGTAVRGKFELALKTRYSGPALEIVTAKGNTLRVTPNHPILTAGGWLPAKQLHEGVDLITDARHADRALQVVTERDHQDSPALAEDVFEALRASAFGLAQCAAFNFHGDAQFGKGDIQIAAADRVLRDDLVTAAAQFLDEWDFGRMRAAPINPDALTAFSPSAGVALVRGSEPSQFVTNQRIGHAKVFGQSARALRDIVVGIKQLILTASEKLAALTFPRRRALAFDSTGGALDFLPFEPLGCGLPPNSDALLFEEPGNGAAPDASGIGQSLDALAVEVTLDKIVAIREFDFAGHVYDFQTDSGLLVADGIIAHNCRCMVRALTEAQANERGYTGEGDKLQPPDFPDEGWDYNPAEQTPGQLGQLLK